MLKLVILIINTKNPTKKHIFLMFLFSFKPESSGLITAK